MNNTNSRIEDTEKFAKLFSELPKDKKAVVIAFMNGMETQKTIDESRNAKEVKIDEE